MAAKKKAKKPTKMREPQYKVCLDVKEKYGITKLGLMSNQTWIEDPKRLLFMLSRYKFVSKMLAGRKNILEVGCADAFGTRIVAAETGHITATDFDPVFIRDARSRRIDAGKVDHRVHDMLTGPVPGGFDGAYALDVLEHIPSKKENIFISNLRNSLSPHAVLIVGMPSLQSQAHASPPSRAGHVNCKDAPQLKALMEKYFRYVFIFSMNDEVVHTGFHPMANYLFALCCEPLRP